MATFKLSLVENALDFWQEAIACLNDGSPRKLKYSVLHLCSAVELLLKARLSQEHWSLIFKEPAKASQESFAGGEFASADFWDLQDRLENICRLDLKKYRSLLKHLRRFRNQINHSKFSIETEQATAILVKTWSFLLDFMHDHMDEESDAREGVLDVIRGQMTKHEGFVETRRKEIAKSGRANGACLLKCPRCFQDFLRLSEDAPSCLFCTYECSPKEAADEWATVFVGYPHTDPKERTMYPVVEECPECGEETMIRFADGDIRPPDPAWACFSCGESGAPTCECTSCGEEFRFENPEEFECPSCRGLAEPE